MTPAERELLEDNSRLLVRRVAARGDFDPVAAAMYSAAAGDRVEWTGDDWENVLAHLDAFPTTIGAWLNQLDAVGRVPGLKPQKSPANDASTHGDAVRLPM